MKKTSINILCILIILLITGSILTPVLYFSKFFYAGFKSGIEQTDDTDNGAAGDDNTYDPSEFNIADIYFEPDISTIISSNDSLVFENGEQYQTIISRATLMIPKDDWMSSYSWVVDVLYLACLVLYVQLLIQFIRFIININRGNIFVMKNVTRLRRFAWYLISISVLKCIAGTIEDYTLSALNLKITGYTMSAYWEMPWGTMLLGLLALLMAQIWSLGMQMKEEQELTI